MTNSVLCLCEDIQDSSIADHVLHLSHLGEQANIHLGIEAYYNNLAGKLDDISKDLLRIASYVYVADTSVSRGGSADIWGKGWKRKFDFKIPVLQPYIWNDSTVKKNLQNVLSFLSEDHFEFTFSQWQDPIRQEFLNLFKTANEGIGADAVVLFSGGLDSLYATGILALTDKKKPLLISHLSTNKIVSRQRMLVEAIKDTCASSTDWTFPHWAVRISRQGSEAKDRTQRTRSFLYATLGVTAAHALQVSDVFLCDNGVVSINLPLTVSCARTHSMTKYQPHCGVCTQCLDRRLATVYAGLESEDPLTGFTKDKSL